MNRIFPIFISSKLIKSARWFLDICLRNRNFQNYVNERFDRDEFIQVYGSMYRLTSNIINISLAQSEYNLDGVGGAVVLDIGGSNGCFAIPASYKARHVYVVEPLYTEELKQNVVYNGISNITVLKIGLGLGTQRLAYHGKSEEVACYPFYKIIDMCGGHVDFLKIDCEGAEWSITRDDLNRINRIEMELHGFNGELMDDFLTRLVDFDYTIDHRTEETWIIHAVRKIDDPLLLQVPCRLHTKEF